jgi:hypothetical protein
MPNVSHQDGGGGGVGGGGVGRLGLGGTVYCVIPAGDCFSTLMSSHVERLVSSRPAIFRSGSFEPASGTTNYTVVLALK